MMLLHKFATILEMIKWEHSVFALPFALTGAMLAAGGWPRGSKDCGVHGAGPLCGDGL